MGLSLPLVEFYALELVAVWLSLAALVALVVAGALVVELVDAVAAPVRVATVSPLCQSGLNPSPMVSALPQVSRVVCCLLRGLHHPVLGLALVHSTQLPFFFSFPFLGFLGLGSFLGFGVFTCFAFLGFFLVAAPWIHLLPYQVWVLGASLVVPLGLRACLDPPPVL